MLWNIIFYLTGLLVLLSSGALLFVRRPMHAAFYLICSLLAIAVLYYLLGSSFIAALQIILYIGAIMVLYLFFIMLSPAKSHSIHRRQLILPVVLTGILLAQCLCLLAFKMPVKALDHNTIIMSDTKALGLLLFGSYKIALEAVSVLLLAALSGVIHLAGTLKSRSS